MFPPQRFALGFRPLLLCSAAAVLFAAIPPGAASDIELLMDTDWLEPGTTPEFRFARPMIAAEDIGAADLESPVVIEPEWSGTFTWLSTRSGVFVPQEPPPLGAGYVVTARPDLVDTAGAQVGKGFTVTLATPRFGATVIRNGVFDPENVPPTPQVAIAFNAAMPADAARFQFVGSEGTRIPASVRHANNRDYFNVQPAQDDWAKRWELARGEAVPPAEEEEFYEDEEDTPAKETFPARLIITPVGPLHPGERWGLEVAPGITSADGKSKLDAGFTVELGLVEPFELSRVTTSNYLNAGRVLTVQFTHPIAPDIDAANAAEIFRIEPEVEGVEFEPQWDGVVARGDFVLGRKYTVSVAPDLISRSGLPVTGDLSREFTVAPVRPRIYLPAFAEHQYSGGTRAFDILSANLAAVRVTVRKIDPGSLPAALEAFAAYHKDHTNPDPDEPYAPVDLSAFAPEILYEATLPVAPEEIDAAQTTRFDWGEATAGSAALFIAVEGEPMPEVGGARPGAQAIVQLTDLGVLRKMTGTGMTAFVFSMETGKPVPGATLALYDKNLSEIVTATTDASGSGALPRYGEAAWMLVQTASDAHAFRVGGSAGELPTAAFGVPLLYYNWPSDPSEAGARWRGLVFTDRPLYRPGETVRVKGILRAASGATLEVATGVEGHLKLTDPRGQTVTELDVVTGERGSFDAELPLGMARPGRFQLQFTPAGDENMRWQPGFSASFLIADFEPDAFEVGVEAKSRFAPDEEVSARVTAKYLFGAPITAGDVRWTLHHGVSVFSAPGFEGFSFAPPDFVPGRTTVSGRAALGADGTTLNPELPDPAGMPQTGMWTVEVTDLNQQTVSSTLQIVRDGADFYPGVERPEYGVIRAGDPLPLRAIALRPDGTPAETDIVAELVRREYLTVRVLGAGGAMSFRTETREEVVATANGRALVPERGTGGWIVPEGESATFTPPTAGSYSLRVRAKDSAGRPVAAAANIFVSGPEHLAWDYRNPAQIDLVADKEFYAPGETARLLVKTPISGRALVSVERGHEILRTQEIELEGNAPVIEIPVSAGDAPNLFVSLILLRGAKDSPRKFPAPEFRYGLTMLTVRDEAQRLTVSVHPETAEVQPGDTVSCPVQVIDGNGRPVEGAEVTFFAVDDGVLNLVGYERPDPQTIFSAPFPLAVRVALTLYSLLPESPEDLEFSNKGYLIGGGGPGAPDPKTRTRFPGTAAWLPSLITDADGTALATFEAPDALTRYRLVAVAHAGAAASGSGESAVRIRKPLSLLSGMGGFANEGDLLVSRWVVRNDTGADRTVSVQLRIEGGAAAEGGGELIRTLEVPDGEAAVTDFPLRFGEPGRVRLACEAWADGTDARDAMEFRIAVGSPAPLLRETYLPDIAGPRVDLLENVNPQLVEGRGRVAVTISNSRLGSLGAAVDYLIQYPYGCAEQTLSSLVPWILGETLTPIVPGTDFSAAEEAVRAAMEKLTAMRAPDGGLAFWPGHRTSNAFATAYAAILFAEMRDRGLEGDLKAGDFAEYLSTHLDGSARLDSPEELTEMALCLYALARAGAPDEARQESLFQRASKLPMEARGLLALALHESGATKKQTLSLLDPKKPAPEAFSWFGGQPRERAILLLARCKMDPGSKEIAPLVRELLDLRTNGRWATTPQNAWALLALATYRDSHKSKTTAISGQIRQGESVVDFSLGKETPSSGVDHEFGPDNPLTPMAVTRPETGPALFGEVRFEIIPPLEHQPAQNRGYAVRRSYEKIDDAGGTGPAKNLRPGDRIAVTLHVETTRAGNFVVVDDPLPAILEAVNPEFRSRASGAGAVQQRSAGADHFEMHPDRVVFYFDRLSPGQHRISYLARVRTAGVVSAPPTKVEEMYRPERFGLGESGQMESAANP